MGKAARARGTYEERRAMAIERNAQAQAEKEAHSLLQRVELANLASDVQKQLAAKLAAQELRARANPMSPVGIVNSRISMGRRAGLSTSSLMAAAALASIPGIKQ